MTKKKPTSEPNTFDSWIYGRKPMAEKQQKYSTEQKFKIYTIFSSITITGLLIALLLILLLK